MKKKLGLLALGAVVVAWAVIFMWPLSFSAVFDDMPDGAVIRVAINDTGIEWVDGTMVPHSELTTHAIAYGSETFGQLQQILGRYSRRRTRRTFFSDASMMGNEAGFWLTIDAFSGDDRRVITTGGTREIIVNGRVYRVGYWRNRANLQMMNEIRNLLEG